MSISVNPLTSGESLGVAAMNYTPISTSATTVVKTGQGIFAGVVVTNAGTSWTVTVYDNTAGSGQVLIPTTTAALGGLLGGIPAGVGVLCATGITVVTSGTAGALYVLWL